LVYLSVFHAYVVFLLGTSILKGLTARRLYKSFGVKELTYRFWKLRLVPHHGIFHLLSLLTHERWEIGVSEPRLGFDISSGLFNDV
jgi:hypothetical protein